MSQWVIFIFAGLNRLKPASGKKYFVPVKMPTLVPGVSRAAMASPLRMTLVAAAVTAVAAATCLSSEWKKYGDMCYWGASFNYTWNDAQIFCPELFPGSDLVSVDGVELDAFLAEQIMNGTEAWLGLYYNSSAWVWTDGTTSNYTNWYAGSTTCTTGCCATINYHNEGDWIGRKCATDYHPFICQIAAS